MEIAERLQNLAWQKDRLILNDIVFRLEHFRDDSWDLADQCFSLYRTPWLMADYARFFALHPRFRPQRVLELGMWDWGSGAFWLECLRPDKYVGVDLARKEPTRYLKSYMEKRDCADRFRAYWETDQTDETRLRAIVAGEFEEPMDLIIDDASHMYDATKRSFEILLPHLRPGGFYLIEDWAWAHWPAFEPDNRDLPATGLTPLITELVEMIGTGNSVLSEASIYTGFAAFRRADGVPGPGQFAVDDWIARRKPGGSMDDRSREAGAGAAGGRLGRALASFAQRLGLPASSRSGKPPRRPGSA